MRRSKNLNAHSVTLHFTRERTHKLECVYYNVKQYLKLISALLSLKHYNGCKMTNNEYELSVMFYLFIYLLFSTT